MSAPNFVWAQKNLPDMRPIAPTDLCPDTANISSSNTNNLNDVQADIDRLGLCVERAKLLQELDALVTKRQALLTGEGVDGLLLPALPLANSKQNLSISNQPPKLDNPTINNTLNRAVPKATQKMAAPLTTSSDMADNSTSYAWAIQRIWGQTPNMSAQIIAANGTIATVVVGEPLPDGYAVESISARGVILSRAGKLLNLDWEKKSAIALTEKGQ